jgi:hypothetical protein
MQGFLTQNCRLDKVADYAAANTTDVTSSGVDMAADGGWDGVCFFTSYVAPAANNLFHLESSSDDASADAYTDIAGSEVDLGGASDEDQYVDVINPPERYVRAVAQRGTSSALGDIWALRYRGKSAPVTNSVLGTQYGKCLTAPLVGTK